MGISFKDQILKSGIVNKKQGKAANHEKRAKRYQDALVLYKPESTVKHK